MQVVVKTHRIKLKMVGDIPEKILNVLKAEYGDVQVITDEDDELINVQETDWYKTMKESHDFRQNPQSLSDSRRFNTGRIRP